VYFDGTVPKHVQRLLRHYGAEMVDMDRPPAELASATGGQVGGMFWRFLVAADTSVDRFIIRDSDSRLNPRERLAVEEWIASGELVHTIRDHPNHDRPLNGGMWGGTRNAVPDMAALVASWPTRDKYMADLYFLEQRVWPRVKHSQLAHDAYTCHKHPNSKPFPTKRPADFQHVGQVFFGDGTPRQGDIDDFMLRITAPPPCRRQPDWIYG